MFDRRMSFGFTLIELLVVVAIISLLMSILLPALGSAKMAAQTLKCSTNVRLIANAAFHYSQDHKGYVPRDYWPYDLLNPSKGNFAHYFFATRLMPYVGGQEFPLKDEEGDSNQSKIYDALKPMDAYKCPTLRGATVDGKELVLHYVANGRSWGSNSSSAISRIDNVPGAASGVAYLGEINLATTTPLEADWFGHYDVWQDGHVPYKEDSLPNDRPRLIKWGDKRHNGRSTLAFFDGHAEGRDISPARMPYRLFYPAPRDAEK